MTCGQTADGDAGAGTADHPLSTRDLQRIGGIASHVVAGTYVIGLLGMLVYLVPQGFTDALVDPAASLEFLADQQVAMYAWYLILHLVEGAALSVLVLAVHERMHVGRPVAISIATAFGLIGSGLLLASGMIALVGQRAALELASTDRYHLLARRVHCPGRNRWRYRTCRIAVAPFHLSRRYPVRGLPTGLAPLGIALGVVGLWTLLPATADAAAALFAIGLIVWFTWTGHTLLFRSEKNLQTPTGAA